jgi:2Fe-2S ferredoxin
MPKITFLPMNLTLEVQRDQSILDIAIDHDVPLQHACGGFCACTTCHVIVKSGGQGLSPMEDEEQERLERLGDIDQNSRLGCQSKVIGDVVVEVVNIDDH